MISSSMAIQIKVLKKTHFLVFCIFLISLVTISTAQERQTISLNTDWEFMPNYVKRPTEVRPVTLPHTWNVGDVDSGKKDYHRGEGSYGKELFIPSKYKGKRLFLKFEGVANIAWVFLNGAHIGSHKGGYSAFSLEITNAVAYGQKNSLIVKVSNAYQIDVLPLGGDFTKYGGIYRPVALLVTEEVCITPLDFGSPGVYITPSNISKENAKVTVLTKISNGSKVKKNCSVVTAIMNSQNNIVASHTQNIEIEKNTTISVSQEVFVENPILWNGKENPYRYKARVSIHEGQNKVDSITEHFGIRNFHVDPDYGFFLNGSYIDLHGVNRHQDKAGKGNALLKEDHISDMEMIKDMGANLVRLSHYQHAQPIYDYADEHGLAVWTEIPLVGQGGYRNRGYYPMESFHENAKQQLKELIRQNYNHPSVFFYGLFNELKDLEGNPLPLLKELNALAKEEDPSRYTVAASNIDESELNEVTDLIAWNKYFGWYGEVPSEMGVWADSMHKKMAGTGIAVSEYGAGASVKHHADSLVAPNPGGTWHPEEWQTYFHEENWRALHKRPFVWGKMIWNMFDFSSSKRKEGDRLGMNDKGLVTFDRRIKKDAFYFYKANWNSEPMLYLAEKRNLKRSVSKIAIKAYGNLGKVELFVNGKTFGTNKANLAIYLWEDIPLREGKNEIHVKAKYKGKSYQDSTLIDYHKLRN